VGLEVQRATAMVIPQPREVPVASMASNSCRVGPREENRTISQQLPR
jgi:hypothetical protein